MILPFEIRNRSKPVATYVLPVGGLPNNIICHNSNLDNQKGYLKLQFHTTSLSFIIVREQFLESAVVVLLAVMSLFVVLIGDLLDGVF